MNKQSVDNIIINGIKGTPEIKKEEKNKYLGTYRERVEIVLTSGQVMKSKIYKEVEKIIKNNKNINILLNGDISYHYLSKYIQIANAANIPFSIVQNNESNTDIGLVIANKQAVDKETILIKE